MPFAKAHTLLPALLATLALAACGGGGDDGGTPSLPRPTPAPTPGQKYLVLLVSGAGRIDTVPEGGFTCSNASCRIEFLNSTTLTLRATPAAGQAFIGWTGACSGKSLTCSFRLDRELIVGANFAPAALAY